MGRERRWGEERRRELLAAFQKRRGGLKVFAEGVGDAVWHLQAALLPELLVGDGPALRQSLAGGLYVPRVLHAGQLFGDQFPHHGAHHGPQGGGRGAKSLCSNRRCLLREQVFIRHG